MKSVSNFGFRIPAAEWKSLAAGFVFELLLFVSLGAAAVWLISKG